MATIKPALMRISPLSGEMQGATERYVKRIGELSGCYADEASYRALAGRRGGDIAYVVDHFVPTTNSGDLIFGTSTLEPGDVAGEYFMTRGHLHSKADRPEIYQCLAGQGVMLMESVDGRVVAIEMVPDHLVYVPPYWIHRSVNVGQSRFVTLFCYPADAGQDYEIIASAGGMAMLVMSDGSGGWTQVPNPRYRGRPASSS